MKIRTLLILTLVLLLYTSTPFYCQHAVGALWENEVILSRFNETLNAKQRGFLYNNMVVTSSGRIVVATTEMSKDNINQIYGYYLLYSDNGGNTWSNPIRFTPIDLVVGGSSLKLASDRNDFIYVIWNSVNPKALFVSKLDHNLNYIFDSVRVSSNLSYGNFTTHLTIDNKDRIHVMWHEGSTNSTNTAEAFYSRSTDGGISWQPVIPLSTNDGHHSAFPHAQFDNGGDTLAIAWRDSVGGSNKWDVYLVYTTNGGESWSAPVPTVTSVNSDWDPDLLVDNQNRIHLFYTVYPVGNQFWGARNYYSFTDNLGSNWYFPAIPSNGMISDNYRSQLIEGTRYDEQRNLLYVTWKDERDFDTLTGNVRGDIMLAISTDRGLTWQPPEFITDRYDSTVGFKAGTILQTGEYAVNYEVLSQDDINNPDTYVRVYFRKRSTSTTNIKNENQQHVNFVLCQNYPNPFNNSTKISYQLPYQSNVILKVYNTLGSEIALLENETKEAGYHESIFNTKDLPSGIYFYKINADGYTEMKKMILLK